MATKLHITQDQVYESDGELYFWIRLSDTHVLRDIPVNFSRALRKTLNDMATHADIIGYRKMKKPELIKLLNEAIKIDIPENLQLHTIPERNILMEYYDFKQVYIPKTQQTTGNTGERKFWLSDDKKTKFSIFISNLTVKELRSICKAIEIPRYSTHRRQELITLLEDKLVFEEIGI